MVVRIYFFLKMRSADKVTLVNTFYGAYLGTFAAVGAFFVIYYRKVVLHGDGTRLTVLLALATADTAV